MPILYALIARGPVVLAEYSEKTGNFPTVTRVLLGKIPPIDGKMSYVYDKHVFHYLVEGNVTYLCMADEGMKRRIPFTFLEDIKRRFVTQYGEAAHNAIAFAFNNEFSPVLQARARARARARHDSRRS